MGFSDPRLNEQRLEDIVPSNAELRFMQKIKDNPRFAYVHPTEYMPWLKKSDGTLYKQFKRLAAQNRNADPPAFVAPATTIMDLEGSTPLSYDIDSGNITTGVDVADLIQAGITGMIDGGFLWLKGHVFDLSHGLSLVGSGAPPLGTEVSAKTWGLLGEGRWNSVLRAQAPTMNIIEASNALSLKLADMYLNQNGKNGYPIRGLDSGVSNRCLMRSEINNVEIHGIASGYYAMRLTNPYFINSYKLMFICAPNGIQLDCTSTGYGNQHFENNYIHLTSTNGIGVRLLNAGANMGEHTFMRTHIDGNSDAAGNKGIVIDGANYSDFFYTKLEQFGATSILIDILDGKFNRFHGGYHNTEGTFYHCAAGSFGNIFKDSECAAGSGTPVLVDDDNTDTLKPNIYEDLTSYYGSWDINNMISRVGPSTARFKGLIAQKYGNNRGTATMPSGTDPYIDVTHNLCLTPISVHAIGNNADVKDLWISNITLTTFRINAVGVVGANRTIYWDAST